MISVFNIQLIVSFFVGGSFVALLTFLAEKATSRLSGIILSFPSTVLLGFFFLAWTQSPEEVASIVPGTLVPMGITVLFPVFYVYIAQFGSAFIQKRLPLILLSFFISVSIWLLFALFVAQYKMSNLFYGIIGYLILTTIAYFLLSRSDIQHPQSHSYSVWQIIGRAVFVGFLVALVVYLGEVVNPFWGGVFAMFPAALSSSLMVIHWYYGPKTLLAVFKEIPLGSLSIFVYAITVMFVFPVTGFVWGTLIALVASLITSILLSELLHLSDNKKDHIR